jgi:hypothetical protein
MGGRGTHFFLDAKLSAVEFSAFFSAAFLRPAERYVATLRIDHTPNGHSLCGLQRLESPIARQSNRHCTGYRDEIGGMTRHGCLPSNFPTTFVAPFHARCLDYLDIRAAGGGRPLVGGVSAV